MVFLHSNQTVTKTTCWRLYLVNECQPWCQSSTNVWKQTMVKCLKRPHITAAPALLGVVRNTGSWGLLSKFDVDEILNVIPIYRKISEIPVEVKDKLNSQRLGLFCLLWFYNLVFIFIPRKLDNQKNKPGRCRGLEWTFRALSPSEYMFPSLYNRCLMLFGTID